MHLARSLSCPAQSRRERARACLPAVADAAVPPNGAPTWAR